MLLLHFLPSWSCLDGAQSDRQSVSAGGDSTGIVARYLVVERKQEDRRSKKYKNAIIDHLSLRLCQVEEENKHKQYKVQKNRRQSFFGHLSYADCSVRDCIALPFGCWQDFLEHNVQSVSWRLLLCVMTLS